MLSFDIRQECTLGFEVKGAKPDSKLAKVIDGTITEITAKDLAGATAIRDYAFYYWQGENIEIPSTVKSVGANAFYQCANMQSDIELQSVESVGEKAFQYSGITSLVLGANAKTHGNYAFANCPNLKTVTLENGVKLGNYMFSNSALESVEFPPSVNNIPSQAFNRCSNLKKVVFPETLNDLSSYSFQSSDLSEGVVFKSKMQKLVINSEAFRATKLREIDLPNGASRLYNATFMDCTELKRVYLPPTAPQLDSNTFNGCTALENLTVDSTKPPAMLNTLGVIPTTAIIYVPASAVETYKTATNWSKYADQIQPYQDIVIEDGVTEITDSQFAGLPIASVYVPASVTSIAANAFSNCNVLQNITVADENPNYSSQDGVLYDNANAEYALIPNALVGDVVIREGVTSVDFSNCANLTGLVLPQTLTRAEDYAFAGLTSLKSLVIPKNVSYLGAYAFWNSDLSEGLVFETTDLKQIQYRSFVNTKLTKIELPEGLEILGDERGSAFSSNNRLQSIVLPSTLKKTGRLVEYGYYHVQITSKAVVPPMATERLILNNTPSKIYVPKGSLEAYKTATNWSEWAGYMVEIEE